jgi:hypothetical protein
MNSKQMRITDAELATIKSLFAENEEGLKIMRKIFLPEIDYDAPLGQVVDMWMPVEVDEVSPEQAIINIKARKTLIVHVESCLMQLRTLAGTKEETVESTKDKLMKNSNK